MGMLLFLLFSPLTNARSSVRGGAPVPGSIGRNSRWSCGVCGSAGRRQERLCLKSVPLFSHLPLCKRNGARTAAASVLS